MRKWIILIGICLLALFGCSKEKEQPVASATPSFDFLQRVTLSDLDHRIEKKEPMFVYFCWTQRASECTKIQEQYLEPNIEYYRWNGLLTVVDLDEEMPEGFEDKSKRALLTEKYGIRYAPAFVFFYEGKIQNFIEWTPEYNDVTTGIPADRMNDWMKSVNLIQ